MIIKTASYNDGGAAYNAAATESWWASFRIRHRMNAPAEAWVTLDDPTGAIMQKYNVDANDVYVGPGRIYIKNDLETVTYFDGRIMKATHDRESATVTLYCQDWLSQLDEKHITYDFREDLSGSDDRYDYVWPDMDGIAATTARPAYSGGAESNWIMCDLNDYHGVDEWNGMKIVFLAGMSGEVSSKVGPYDGTASAVVGVDSDAFDTDIEGLWNDDSNGHLMSDNDEDFNVVYSFYNWINAAGTDYHSSTKSMTVRAIFYLTTSAQKVDVEIYDNNAAAYVKLEEGIVGTENAEYIIREWRVPLDIADDCTDASGITKVRFSVDWTADVATLSVSYITVETTCIMTQEDSAYTVTDTASSPDKIEIAEDTTLAGTGCWTGQPFAICQEIYKHIDDDNDPASGLVSGHHPLVEITHAATIEHTSGISVRRYEERTSLEILQDVCMTDKAVFWMELGTATLTWKSTFNAGAPTALADANVLAWSQGGYDYEPMRNEYHLYGPRQNDNQIILNTADFAADPGSDSKSTFGATRSGVIKGTGTNTEYEIYNLGNAIVERDEDVLLFLSAQIKGISTTYKLGTEVSVTSTPLSLAAVAYIVSRWEYDHDRDITTIQLHPRSASTKGLIEWRMFGDEVRYQKEQVQQMKADTAMLEVIE